MHPQVKIVGQLADGTIAPIIVSPDGTLLISGGGSSGGNGDASAANQLTEIEKLTNIGDKTDTPADINRLYPSIHPLTEQALQADPMSAIALLKGIFESCSNEAISSRNVRQKKCDEVLDQSGDITVANQGFLLFSAQYQNARYLLIQNPIISNSPTGNLYVNFGFSATAGEGSIQIKSGETFELYGGSLLGQTIYLLGDTVGLLFTAKIAVDS